MLGGGGGCAWQPGGHVLQQGGHAWQPRGGHMWEPGCVCGSWGGAHVWDTTRYSQ